MADAHTLTVIECKDFARDVFEAANDRDDKQESLEDQITDFHNMRCAQGDRCIYNDTEDSARILGWLADMYGPKHDNPPAQLGGDAYDECMAHANDKLPGGAVQTGPQIGT
jgi:hypothetical protein